MTGPQAEDPPLVSVVIPTLQEADRLPATLARIAAQTTDREYEVVVADGGSTDGTREIAREHCARVVRASGGIGAGRDAGARAARGEWLAFVDADTRVRPDYVEEMLGHARERGLVGLSSRCRVTGPRRARFLQFVTNRAFLRADPPVLPGFNTFVRADAYAAAGGFPDAPNEDKSFSRELAAVGPTGYHPERLVETAGRRVAEEGLLGTSLHYFRKDLAAIAHEETGETLDRPVTAALLLAVLGGVLQFAHAGLLGHATAALAGLGFLGGGLLFVMDVGRRRLFEAGLAFLAVQWGYWVTVGPHHGPLATAVYAAQIPLAVLLVYCRLAGVETYVPTADGTSQGR